MPYKKKSYRRKGGLKKYIKKVVARSQETKTHLINYANAIPDSGRTPLSNQLADISQGLNQSTRVGNSITLTSLKYDWFFTGADSTNSLRVIIYVPKDPTDLMSSVAFNAAPDLDRYTILRDMFITTEGTGGNCKRRQGWLRFNRGNRSGMNVGYTGAGLGVIIKNNVSIYMVSDSLAATDPQVNGYVRIFYKDG